MLFVKCLARALLGIIVGWFACALILMLLGGFGVDVNTLSVCCLFVALLGGTWWGFMPLVKQIKEEQAAEKRAQESAENALLQCEERLASLLSNSSEAVRTLPTFIRKAELALDEAQDEFNDGAFAPFWDAIERSICALAEFNAVIQRVTLNASSYRSEASGLPTCPPIFRVNLQAMPDASGAVQRMRQIVRRAQKHPDFAKIYEMRRMNQLLVSGFASLGQALNEVGDRLGESIDKLREQVAHDSEERRLHEDKTREMLDNIQRRRKPYPQKPGDGDY